MHRDRYKEIFRNIRFDDPTTRAERIENTKDKLQAIRTLYDQFTQNCIRQMSIQSLHENDNKTIVSYLPKKNKSVILLSTQFNGNDVSDEETNFKSEIIPHYNKIKGAVDTGGKMTHEYRCVCACRRWPSRIFMEMIGIAALNAYIVWSKKYPEWRKKDRSRRRSFTRELSIQLAENNVQGRKVYNTGQNIPIKSAIDMFLRETEKNLPGPNPNQELGEIQANTIPMSVKKEDKFGIVQFHGENFSTWKFRVEVILQEYGVFECLTKDPPADEAARKNFDQQDNKAKSIIIQCVADSHLEYVREVLEDVKELEKPINIGVAKAGEDLEGTHVGSIRVSNNVDGKIHNYTLLYVIYVPNLRKNSLSVGKIEEKGSRVDFHKHQIFIMKDISDSTNLSTQVSHSSETNGSTFEEEEVTDTETEGVENVSPVTDEVNANRDINQEKRCLSRSHQPPLWLNDYEVNYVAESSNNTFSIAYSTNHL
ncbi:hypothetical protein JTB14_012268 [Gonioctena quinquepunctata]|nr:hypothetical protein JTB14_012268 [Gonioctena quinquepunctata]